MALHTQTEAADRLNRSGRKAPEGAGTFLEHNFGHSGLETKLWIVILLSLGSHSKINRIMG